MGYGLMFAVITAAIISGVAAQRMRVSQEGCGAGGREASSQARRVRPRPTL